MKLFLSAAGTMGDQMVARIMADRIEALGHTALMDLNGIRGGENWKIQTRSAIADADWFLALISENYKSSKAGNWHITQAFAAGIPILPVLIERTDHFLLEDHTSVEIIDNVSDGVQELITRLQTQTDVDRVDQLGDQLRRVVQGQMGEMAEEQAEGVDRIARVFIAYSRKQREHARQLHELLTRNGKAVFWDAKIHAGATWRQTIQRALDDCTHLIVIWTPDAAQSDEVEREVSYALSEGKVIIPILSPDIPKLPYHLHGFHYVILRSDLQMIEAEILTAIEKFTNDDLWH